MGRRTSRAQREIEIMASKTRTQTAAKPATRTAQDRKPITLEMALLVCPHATLAANLSRTFGLEPVDTAGIRESTEEHLALATKDLPLTDKALEMHLQRVVGAFVSSAFGAGQFYSQKVSQAKDLTAKVANEDRGEDRDGVSGFDSRAERARNFAAEMGLQAHALAAAAEGAVSAYAHLTGSEWKPYEAPSHSPNVSRASAAAQMGAFEG
jgi:hypothetical protein